MPALDATSSGTSPGGTTVTVAHTCTGTNLVLTVKVVGWSTSSSNGFCTGVTYNGVAMTLIADSGFSTANDRATIWRLVNPATGAHNIVASFNGAGAMAMAVVGESYTDAHQTVSEGAPATAVGNNAAPTVTATCATSDFCIDAVAIGAAVTATMTADTGRTQTHNSSADGEVKATSRDVSPGASEVMDWSLSAGATWAIAAIVIKDVAPPASPKYHGRRSNGPLYYAGRRPARF